jgi:hypothetical protein
MSIVIVQITQVPGESTKESKVKHLVGLPPEVAPNPQQTPVELPPANILVIVQSSGESFSLYRFTQGGDFAGDTWHLSLDDVYHQAQYEYGVQPTDWIDEENPKWEALAHQIEGLFRGG